MTNNPGARAIADVFGGVILATIQIDAPPARVFEALASEQVVDWWGDATSYHAKKWQGDVRPGGTWRVDGEAADGSPYDVSGEYLEVDPPWRLVHTWRAAWTPGATTVVSYFLEAADGGTKVTLRHEGFADDHASCRQHAVGWERVLGWLEAYCTGNSVKTQ